MCKDCDQLRNSEERHFLSHSLKIFNGLFVAHVLGIGIGLLGMFFAFFGFLLGYQYYSLSLIEPLYGGSPPPVDYSYWIGAFAGVAMIICGIATGVGSGKRINNIKVGVDESITIIRDRVLKQAAQLAQDGSPPG